MQTTGNSTFVVEGVSGNDVWYQVTTFASGFGGAVYYGKYLMDSSYAGFWGIWSPFAGLKGNALPGVYHNVNFGLPLKFLPVRLSLDGANYYGWVRLRLDNIHHKLFIRETAMNSQPGVAVDQFGVAGSFVDAFENNQSPADAKLISTNTPYQANIRASDDIDWYKFSVADPANNVKVMMKNLAADYDILWFNSSIQVINQSQHAGTSNEKMILNNLANGYYYLEVKPKPGAFDYNQPYLLVVVASDSVLKMAEAETINEITVKIVPNPAPASAAASRPPTASG